MIAQLSETISSLRQKYFRKAISSESIDLISQYQQYLKYFLQIMKQLNQYCIYAKQILGKGSFGTVYKCLDESKRQLAAKVIDKKLIDRDEYLKRALISQIEILQKIKSPHIVEVVEVVQSKNNFYIIQERCQQDLQEFLDEKGRIEEKQALKLLTEICYGFLTLIREGVIHRDLKPSNIMIGIDGKLKIGDFGLAKRITHLNMKNLTVIGTPLYMSNEILNNEPYTSKCDIWALGIILYQMIHGYPPWQSLTPYQHVENLNSKPLKISEQLHLSQNMINFIEGCLQINQKNRMSWDQVFKHPLFEKQFVAYAEQNKNYENKLKNVMNNLRFKINSENINIQKLMQIMGFDQDKQLNFTDFSKFLSIISPGILLNQIRFIFQKLDIDQSETISIEEIQSQLEKHNIMKKKILRAQSKNTSLEQLGIENLENLFNAESKIQNLQALENNQQGFYELNKNLYQKVKFCFNKLYKGITKKKLTLLKTFQFYDVSRTQNLTKEQFQQFINKMGDFSKEEIDDIFKYIDTDNSKTIQYSELCLAYCKFNGIPITLQTPQIMELSQI